MTDGNSVERIPQGSLSERQVEELALVGLSPQFPVHVTQLQDAVLATSPPPSFHGYRFTVYPDYSKPQVTAEELRGGPYKIELEFKINHTGRLAISPSMSPTDTYTPEPMHWVELADLQDFAEKLPAPGEVVLISDNRPHLQAQDSLSGTDYARPQEYGDERPPEEATVPILEIADVSDLLGLGFVRDRSIVRLEVGKVGSAESLSLGMPLKYSSVTRGLHVFGFGALTAEGPASDLEGLLGNITTLLNVNDGQLP